MRTLKLTLAYDGTDYVGWQRQTNGLSVQELVETAFLPLVRRAGNGGAVPASREAPVTDLRGPTVEGAGRTDAGVHALGQVASIRLDTDVPASAVQGALNMRLPPDVRVVGVVDAAPGFHARRDAAAKTYRYRIATTPILSPFDRRYVWHTPEARDLSAMRAAAALLVGSHDFASFQAAGSAIRGTARTMHRVEVTAEASGIVLEVEGDGFLRHMVRAIAGTLVDVGAGRRQAESMPAIIAACDRAAAGPTAPAAGLTLVAVTYPAVC